MTMKRGLFVRQTGTAPTAVGTTPLEARVALGGLVTRNLGGQPRSGLQLAGATNVVTGNGTGMLYDVYPFEAMVNRANNEGVYIFGNDGIVSIATTAAPGSNSRWDLIYCKQNDPDKGDADNLAILGVVQGAVAASPTKPYSDAAIAAGTGALVLAEALVTAGVTNTGGLAITNVYDFTNWRGAPVQVRNQTERDEMSVAERGAAIQRTDINAALIEYADASASRWNSGPLGVLSRVKRTADGSAIGAGPTVDQVISSFTFRANRKYLISWFGQHDHSAVPTNHLLQIATCATTDADALTTGLTVLNQCGVSAGIANIGQGFRVEAEYEPGASDVTVKLKAVVSRVSGTGNFVSKGLSTMPVTFMVRDIGNAVT